MSAKRKWQEGVAQSQSLHDLFIFPSSLTDTHIRTRTYLQIYQDNSLPSRRSWVSFAIVVSPSHKLPSILPPSNYAKPLRSLPPQLSRNHTSSTPHEISSLYIYLDEWLYRRARYHFYENVYVNHIVYSPAYPYIILNKPTEHEVLNAIDRRYYTETERSSSPPNSVRAFSQNFVGEWVCEHRFLNLKVWWGD